VDGREIKRVAISEAAPGMITAQDIYSRTDQLILMKDTVLGADSIAKLMFYSVGGIWVYAKEGQDFKEDAYTQALRKGTDFHEFQDVYGDVVKSVRGMLEQFMLGEKPIDSEVLFDSVKKMIGEARSNAHIFNMLHCIRDSEDMVFEHSVNVALICNVFADWMHLADEDKQVLTVAGLLHDAGKLLVPESILNKPGRLTDEEFDIAKMHAESGYEILKNAEIDERIKKAALDHHERFDGSGYPAGKSGNEIDMMSSIVGIADAYDAMTSRRIYRGALCPFDVIRVFEEEGMNLFNPRYLLPLLGKMAETYIHHTVQLSDGSKGEIVMINPFSLAAPVVRVDSTFVDLAKNEALKIDAVL